jgi:hypothetical protein
MFPSPPDELCPECRDIRDEPRSYGQPDPAWPYHDWEDDLCDECQPDCTLGAAVRDAVHDLPEIPPDVIVTLHHLFSMFGFTLEDGEPERALYAVRYLAVVCYPLAEQRVNEWNP